MAIVVAHDAEIGAGLTAAERHQLVRLLGKLAEDQGIGAQGHPGYRA